MGNQPPDNCSGAVPLFGRYYIQFGREDPWTGTATDESNATIRTNLTTIEMGIATVDDTDCVAEGTDATKSEVLYVEPVVSSGAVTVHRKTNGASTQSFSYILIGTQDVTD